MAVAEAAVGPPAGARTARAEISLTLTPVSPLPPGWDLCNLCHQPDSGLGLLCDHQGCRYLLCRRCFPDENRTLWCPHHSPPLTELPILGWKVAPYLLHPGRDPLPVSTEERSTLDPASFPATPHQVMARSLVESSRLRALEEARLFGVWLTAHPDPAWLRSQPPTSVALEFLHSRLMAALVRPVRPVTRPTTGGNWAERLSSAFPGKLVKSQLDRWALGLRALAPAAPTVLRGVTAPLEQAISHCEDQILRQQDDRLRCMWMATWLALATSLRGFRPLPALRASLPQATRSLHVPAPPGQPMIEVAVLLDKDNTVGATPAPRIRELPLPRALIPAFQLLPYPNDRVSLLALGRNRSMVAKAFGISDMRAPRRDAGSRAEQQNLSAHDVLNHAPGSRHDATYVGAVTSTATRKALAAW